MISLNRQISKKIFQFLDEKLNVLKNDKIKAISVLMNQNRISASSQAIYILKFDCEIERDNARSFNENFQQNKNTEIFPTFEFGTKWSFIDPILCFNR